MVKLIAALTTFTFLLITVSAATIASDPVVLPGSNDAYKSSKESTTVAGSDIVHPTLPVLPTEKIESQLESETTANDRLPEVESTQILDVSTIDPVPRLIFSRSVPIQRRSFDRSTRIPLRFVRRHPCRKFKKTFMIPTKRSYGNDMMLSDKVTSVDVETIGDRIPTKWLEFKHKYGHRHHHYYHDVIEGEKMNSFSGHHKEKKRDHKGGFMRRVRKFLKHTFD